MLERLAGNDALKAELGTALRGGRLPHAVLLVGEPGCGAGFAARCLAADYLYPAGGPHAEAVLKKEDTECLVLKGEGASGQIPVKKVREAREAIQRSALSTDAAGRVLFIYGAQNLNGSSANAMLKIIEEPPEGVLFLLTATSAATVLPTIRSRCAAYTIAPVPAADCAARLKAERLPAKAAEELAFLYEGHIGTALKSWNDPTAKAALGMAKTLCGYAAQGDTYRALALLTKYERDKDGFAALLWTLDQLCSAVLRRPAYGQEQCGGLTPAGAAKILNADARARKSLTGNGNLRLNVADAVDVRRMRQNRADVQQAYHICEQRIAAHNLKMKLVDAEYTLDRSKLVFYFTADNRVDFRELVKDLASQFHTRIELRQIGVRDESKMLGGLGLCGQPFCCSRFLKNFQPVSIKMAKEQGLSLNPAKISGSCGRLMCCLAYEQKSYEYLNSITPQVGSIVRTPDGEGTVIEVNVVAGTLKVRSNVEILAPRIYKRDECVYVRGGKRTPLPADKEDK